MQRTRSKRGSQGHSLTITVLFCLLASSMLLNHLRLAELSYQKNQLQITTDLSALSAARLQARALNGLAMLNQALSKLHTLSKTILLTWVALAACASTCAVGVGCVCVAPLAQYTAKAPKILLRIKKFAERIAKVQDQIISAAPTSVLLASKMFVSLQPKPTAILTTPQKELRPKLWVIRGSSENYSNIEACKEAQEVNHCTKASSLLSSPFSLPPLLRLSPNFEDHQKIQLQAHKDYRHKETSLRIEAHATATVETAYQQIDKHLLQANWYGLLLQ